MLRRLSTCAAGRRSKWVVIAASVLVGLGRPDRPLVDTFLVRTSLVPAIAFKLGERNRWPSRISTAAAISNG